MANLTRDIYIGQEIHLNGFVAVALAGFTASAAYIERETSRLVSADFGFGQADKQVADIRKDSRIRGRIGARSTPQRRLVYIHHLIYILQSLDTAILQGVLKRTVKLLRKDGLKRFINQCGLSAARYSRYTNQFAERELHIHIFQVIASCTAQPQAMAVALAPFGRHFNGTFAVQIPGSQRMRPQHLLRSASKYHLTPQPACLGAHIYNVIGGKHHVFIMLHHNHGITHIAQLLQRMDKPQIIALVQSNARLIQYIQHVHQLRAYLRSQPDTLAFAAGEADGAAVQRQIIQSHIQQEFQAGTDFFQYFHRNLLLFPAKILVYVHQPVIQLVDVHCGEFVDVFIVNTE